MEEKLDLILNELKIIKDSQEEIIIDICVLKNDVSGLKADMVIVKGDLEGLKEKQQELKYILDAVKENQDVSNAKNKSLEGIQDRQDRIIEQLSYRYLEHGSEIKDLKREIHQLNV